MRLKPLAVFAVCLGMLASTLAAEARDLVVLLHGCGRTSLSMLRLAHTLEADGYQVLNRSYPSRTQSVETIAREWLPAQLAQAAPAGEPRRIHFVTHSMGGIIVRMWLRECGAPANLGHVVMLAPPNAGSEIPERFAACAPFRWCTGVNAHRLGTAPNALPRQLGPWPTAAAPLGIIAGYRSPNPLLAAQFSRPNDGKVAVAATHLDGERDHLVLPIAHTWIGWSDLALRQVKAFLRHGAFEKGSARRFSAPS